MAGDPHDISATPIFWHRFNDYDTLLQPAIGPALIADGDIGGVLPGKFGNAYYSVGGYWGDRILTPPGGLSLDPEQGAIEAWVRYTDDLGKPYV